MAAVYRFSLPGPQSQQLSSRGSGNSVIMPSYRARPVSGAQVYTGTMLNSPKTSFRVMPAGALTTSSSSACIRSETSPRHVVARTEVTLGSRSPRMSAGPSSQRTLDTLKPQVSTPAGIPHSGDTSRSTGSLTSRGGAGATLQRPRGTNASVNVGGRVFERVRVLGKGSFGVVWEVCETTDQCGKAKRSSNFPLALKCSMPANEKMLEACLLEAEVLQQLAAALPADVAAANRVPQYVAHSVNPTATAVAVTPDSAATSMSRGQTRVLVAMSKLDGKPLDQWLYGIDENRIKTIGMSELLNGPLPGGRLATRDLASASATSASLLLQMSPVFAALAKIAYHRDISAHNFLVREAGEREEFAVLDFGLAVRSSSWQCEYKSRNISGDPRYFSPAAWMLMVYGYKYLDAHPDSSFLKQYKQRMDHFSFGVLALEVFFALWSGREAEAAEGLRAEQVPALAKARAAWRAFWTDAVGFFQMFHTKGASTTRQALARAQAISKYVDKLKTLYSALRHAAKCHLDIVVTSVFEISADLIDPCGSLRWEDLSGLLRRTASVPALREFRIEEGSVEKGSERVLVKNMRSFDDLAGKRTDDSASTPRSLPFRQSLPGRSYTFDEAVSLTRLHGRSWTVDEAVSLMRGVPEVTLGWGQRSQIDSGSFRRQRRLIKKLWQ